MNEISIVPSKEMREQPVIFDDSERQRNLRDVYAQKALCQIPRLLSLQDRNPFSQTYGCFHRDYWLYKTSDFADAVRQFGVQALALVYQHDFPGNIYKGQEKIRDWTIAGMEFWASLQHADGSFDEFYPYERGWVGPSAFTTFAVSEAFKLLKDEIPSPVQDCVLAAIRRAAQFIAGGESEEDHLANHHAMACLAVWKAYELLEDPSLKEGFSKVWQGFLNYHNDREGWSREYDGVDPGYLSATVSFLGKIYQTNPDPKILEVLRQSVEFCSYFVYPNGFYAGSIGSRNTLHFYPHGFEILGKENSLAAAIAEKMLKALAAGKLVPPEIMSDRYVFYRVPEMLQSYLDYTTRSENMPLLPYEKDVCQYFPDSKIFIATSREFYTVANLAKGGVVKIFQREQGKLVLNDCGLIGKLSDGQAFTSQWIDPSYECHADDKGWEVTGTMNLVPSNKLFTPLKNVIFRILLITLGWIPAFAHWLKGSIRRTLILGKRPVPVQFHRKFQIHEEELILSDEICLSGNVRVSALSQGDEFFVRYVPQSRFFQSQELDVKGRKLAASEIQSLNEGKRVSLSQVIAMQKQNLFKRKA